MNEIGSSVSCSGACLTLEKFNKNLAILHCNSSYPASLKEMNLKVINNLQSFFNIPVGLSDHTLGLFASHTAIVLGANIIERHITLDRSMFGTDQSASLEESGIRELTTLLSKFPVMFGNGKKTISREEKKLIPKFRYWETKKNF